MNFSVLPQSVYEVEGWPRRAWNYLTEPHEVLLDPARRKARLLSSMLLCLFVFFSGLNTVYYYTVPGYGLPLPDALCFGIMLMAYALSRTRFSNAAAVCMLLMFPLNVFWSILGGSSPNPTGTLAFLIPGYVLASIFLSALGTAVMGLFSTMLIALLPVIAPYVAPEPGSILAPMAASIISVLILICVLWCRNGIDRHKELQLAAAYDKTLEGWSQVLELRDAETRGHSTRVATLAAELARLMGIPEPSVQHLYRGALLHDIGKLAIPDSILIKKSPLTPEERTIMQTHTTVASQMLSGIPFLQPALDIPAYHHEWWNGEGYPNKLAGEEIPLAARIFAVVDVWDALLSDRPYRPAWTHDQAVEYIRSQSGKQFDPKVVKLFLKLQASGRHSKPRELKTVLLHDNQRIPWVRHTYDLMSKPDRQLRRLT